MRLIRPTLQARLRRRLASLQNKRRSGRLLLLLLVPLGVVQRLKIVAVVVVGKGIGFRGATIAAAYVMSLLISHDVGLVRPNLGEGVILADK